MKLALSPMSIIWASDIADRTINFTQSVNRSPFRQVSGHFYHWYYASTDVPWVQIRENMVHAITWVLLTHITSRQQSIKSSGATNPFYDRRLFRLWTCDSISCEDDEYRTLCVSSFPCNLCIWHLGIVQNTNIKRKIPGCTPRPESEACSRKSGACSAEPGIYRHLNFPVLNFSWNCPTIVSEFLSCFRN